jgi:aryl-alcohol dehydrogenase-like predicted oxidoreductase
MTTADPSTRPVASSGTFDLGGRSVHRLGFGAMQLTGPGVWGRPVDPDECIRVLRRAVDLGVDLIDTADSYGPEVSEDLIAEALRPYPDNLVIATKAGLTRQGPGEWLPVGRPEYLRQQCELSLRRLGLPADEQFGALAQLVAEGKVGAVGLSQVSVDEIKAARAVVPIVSVQNLYNLTDQSSGDVLDYCSAEGLGFIPWFPMAAGALAHPGGPVDAIAKETDASPSQVALAWLLHRSPVMLPIPGTKSVDHLEENCRAATLTLSGDQIASLDAAVSAA